MVISNKKQHQLCDMVILKRIVTHGISRNSKKRFYNLFNRLQEVDITLQSTDNLSIYYILLHGIYITCKIYTRNVSNVKK